MTVSTPATRADVAVVGGGAIGLSVALDLASRGIATTVIDPSPGLGASNVAAGMLAPITELHYGEDALLRLNLESAVIFGDWIDDIEERSGTSTGYRRTGTVMVARDSDDAAALSEVWAHQEGHALKAERMRASEIRRLEPALASTVRGGILVPDDHQVDPAALVDALVAACKSAGVHFVEQKVERFEIAGGRVAGVRVAGEMHEFGVAVLAAGCWSGRIEGLLPGSIPVRPVKGQLVELSSQSAEPLIQRNVRGQDAYLVPRADGRIVVGATVEERGFDTSVTAGAVRELLTAAFELVPGIAEMDLVGVRAGLRPGTPDNAPLLGTTEIEGLIAATGHYRNGILLAPITAALIGTLIETGRAPDVIAPFSPTRFEAGS